MGKNRRKGTNVTISPRNGRPPRLMEPEVYKQIVEAVKLGVPITVACEGVGIARTSYRLWLRRGLAEIERLAEPGAEPDAAEQLYVDFYNDVQAARSNAATRNIAAIQKAAQGGAVTERTVKRYRDPETGEMVEEETIRRSAPDWRAASWYLERAHRSEFGKNVEQHHLILDPNAMPGEDANDPAAPAANVDANDLARRLREHIEAGVTAGVPALEAGSTSTQTEGAGEVYDVEFVEDPPG